MAYIEIIEPEKAKGELKEIYEELIKSRGKLAEIHKIQSLNPETIVKHMDLYMTLMYKKSPLSRAQREMIGVVVSKANNCRYCQIHHLEAANHYWKDHEKAQKFLEDFASADLNKIDLALCNYAWNLTRKPNCSNKEMVEDLKKLGLSDREILDATLIIAYFNFVNRIVLGLGIELEEEPGGYKYN